MKRMVGGHFHPGFAGAHDEAGVGVADAGGEFSERPRRTRVAVGAEKYFAGPGMAFLRHGDVADALIAGRADVVEVLKVLLSGELPEHIDIAVGHLVGSEYVMIGNDDDLVSVPHLGILAEVLFEDANGPRPAHVVGHQDIGIDPNIIIGIDVIPSGVLGQDFFRQGHRGHEFNSEVR